MKTGYFRFADKPEVEASGREQKAQILNFLLAKARNQFKASLSAWNRRSSQ